MNGNPGFNALISLSLISVIVCFKCKSSRLKMLMDGGMKVLRIFFMFCFISAVLLSNT